MCVCGRTSANESEENTSDLDVSAISSKSTMKLLTMVHQAF